MDGHITLFSNMMLKTIGSSKNEIYECYAFNKLLFVLLAPGDFRVDNLSRSWSHN